MAYPIYQPPQSLPPGLLPAQNEGLLGGGNPLLNIGLGILANNQGNYGNAGVALSRGVMQGMQQNLQQQQFAQTNKIRDAQMKAYEREAKAAERKENALKDFDTKFPQFAGLADINPAAAMKIAYPNLAANSADPYFSVVPTNAGLARFDHRLGGLELITLPSGQPAIKSSDDPLTRGAVKAAEAQAGAAWNPNTDIDGVLTTDERLVRDVYGNNPIPFSQPGVIPQPGQPQNGLPTNNFNTPYPVTFGAPGSTATDRLEGTTTDNLGVGNPARPNPVRPLPGGGIRVPTAAEMAAEKKAAEISAEEGAKARADVGKVVAQGEEAIRLVDELVDHPGFESAVGLSSYNPINKIYGEGKNFNIRLDQIKGKQFLQAFESLKGGGQITQVEGEKATNAIARMDTAATEEEFKAAAEDFKSVIQSGINRAKQKAGGSVETKPQTYDTLPKKAPKGQIVRNPQTGERMQFDGLSWRPL